MLKRYWYNEIWALPFVRVRFAIHTITEALPILYTLLNSPNHFHTDFVLEPFICLVAPKQQSVLYHHLGREESVSPYPSLQCALGVHYRRRSPISHRFAQCELQGPLL